MKTPVEVTGRLAGGSFYLTLGQAIALLLGMVFSVVFARILGPEDYGLVGIALLYPSLLVNLTDLGLGGTITRFSTIPSNHRNVYVWSGITLRAIIAGIGGIVVYYLASNFAGILERPYIESYIRILSLYTVSASILSILYGVYAGLGKYGTSAAITISQHALKGILAIVFLYIGLRAYGVIMAYSIAYFVLSVIFLLQLIRKVKFAFAVKETIEILIVALPLYIAVICDVFLKPVLDTIIARYLLDYELGNYIVAFNVIVPIGALSGSIAIAVLTTLPLLIGDTNALGESISELAFYSITIFNSLALLYVSLLAPLVSLLYGYQYTSAPKYAVVLSTSSIIPAILGSFIISNYFITVKTTSWNAVLGVTRFISALITAYVLIPIFGVYGLAFALLVGGVVSTAIGYCILVYRYNTHIDLLKISKASIPAFIAFIVTYIVVNLIKHEVISLVAGFATYTTLYLLLLPLLVNIKIIENIIKVTTRLDYIGVFVSKLAPYYLKLASSLQGSRH